MDRAAAILAGGESSRLKNKALALFAGKPMILHIIDKCTDVADELLVIVNSQEQLSEISHTVGGIEKVRIVVDRREHFQSPLLGAYTAFENSRSKVTLLLACDTPLIKPPVLELLFHIIGEWDAVVPRHPNGHIEPLHSIYKTDISLRSAEEALSSNKRSMRELITRLRTLYLSTDIIKQLDPKLESFINVNTPDQLAKLQEGIDGRKRGAVL